MQRRRRWRQARGWRRIGCGAAQRAGSEARSGRSPARLGLTRRLSLCARSSRSSACRAAPPNAPERLAARALLAAATRALRSALCAPDARRRATHRRALGLARCLRLLPPLINLPPAPPQRYAPQVLHLGGRRRARLRLTSACATARAAARSRLLLSYVVAAATLAHAPPQPPPPLRSHAPPPPWPPHASPSLPLPQPPWPPRRLR